MQDNQNAIATGHLLPGDQLPTEDGFKAIYGYSKTTIRKGLDPLEHRGLIVKYPSRGTFVTPDAPEKLRQLAASGEVQLPPGIYISTDPAVDVADTDTAETNVDLYPGARFVVKKPTKAERTAHRLQKDEWLVVVTHPDGQVKMYGVFNTIFWLRESPPTST